MTRKLLFSLLMLITAAAFAYDKPNSIAYDPVSKSYFITNQKGQTITRLDSNFDKMDVITGLVSPKDLLFANFGPYNGLLVLDSNEVKVFNADDFSFVASFPVNGSIDLEDAEEDKNSPGTFYISDPRAQTIFKAVVGGPPFYTPTFSVLSTKVRNPKALLFDSKYRLLVTSDTTASPVYSVNTSSGSATLLQTTNVDYINSLAEDEQGNFYATSWGDSYLYRLDNSFQSETGLAAYSKPTGLYFNKTDDLIAVACSNCNKVEFHKLHMVYINDADSAKCPSDTFYMNINQQFKGSGTYNAGNTFYTELSDANGKFSTPLIIGTVKASTEPAYFKLSLPGNRRFNGSNYKVRVRSSKPAFYGINEIDLEVPYVPLISISPKDTILFCSPEVVKLGTSKDQDSGRVSYSWFENGKKISNALPVYQNTFTAKVLVGLTKTSFSGKCSVKDSVWLLPSSKIFIPFKDTLMACENTLIRVGGDSIANTKIEWTSKRYPTPRTVFNPEYLLNFSDTFLVKVSSISGSCSSQKNIYAFAQPRPDYTLSPNRLHVCASGSVEIEPVFKKGTHSQLLFDWKPKTHLVSANGELNRFNSNVPGNFTYMFYARDGVYGCYDSLAFSVKNVKQPVKPVLAENTAGAVIRNFDPTYKYEWIKNNKSVLQSKNDSLFEVPTGDTKYGTYRVIVKYSDSIDCTDTSSLITITNPNGLGRLTSARLTIYPNPVMDILTLQNLNGRATVRIADMSGRTIWTGQASAKGEVNVSELDAGIYGIQINFEGRFMQAVFIKQSF